VILDTNVYANDAYKEPSLRIKSLFVSSVVVQELTVIATKPMQKALHEDFLEKLRLGLGVVPDASDWLEVGKCLGRLLAGGDNNPKLSKEEVNLLVRDALLARSAIRCKAVLVTANIDDFSKIKTIFRSLSFKSPSEFFGVRPR
jgi:predicted nucleic acid-binding protein